MSLSTQGAPTSRVKWFYTRLPNVSGQMCCCYVCATTTETAQCWELPVITKVVGFIFFKFVCTSRLCPEARRNIKRPPQQSGLTTFMNVQLSSCTWSSLGSISSYTKYSRDQGCPSPCTHDSMSCSSQSSPWTQSLQVFFSHAKKCLRWLISHKDWCDF